MSNFVSNEDHLFEGLHFNLCLSDIASSMTSIFFPFESSFILSPFILSPFFFFFFVFLFLQSFLSLPLIFSELFLFLILAPSFLPHSYLLFPRMRSLFLTPTFLSFSLVVSPFYSFFLTPTSFFSPLLFFFLFMSLLQFFLDLQMAPCPSLFKLVLDTLSSLILPTTFL